MDRDVLFIPFDEVEKHLNSNTRNDIKIIPPNILERLLYEKLRARDLDVKEEEHLSPKEHTWAHSRPESPNKIYESRAFLPSRFLQHILGPFTLAPSDDGPFALSLANMNAPQMPHYHLQHWELYFSMHEMSGTYRNIRRVAKKSETLKEGGIIIFSPEVIHCVQLTGLTVVFEVPSVAEDKIDAPL